MRRVDWPVTHGAKKRPPERLGPRGAEDTKLFRERLAQSASGTVAAGATANPSSCHVSADRAGPTS